MNITSNIGAFALFLFAAPAFAQSMPDMPGMQHDAMPTQASTQSTAPMPMHDMLDDAIHAYTLIDRLEAWHGDSANGQAWKADGWIGTDTDRLWWRSEGERDATRTQAADLEALYGHSVSTWWDVVAGVREDFKPGDAQTFAAFGVQGLAPQKFRIEATAYLGEHGQSAARIEIERDLLLGNRLILQPQVEANLYARDDAARGIGAGLGDAEAGLRLRYEITRRFAPYLGIDWQRAFGKTADLRRALGEEAHDTRLLAGVRLWF